MALNFLKDRDENEVRGNLGAFAQGSGCSNFIQVSRYGTRALGAEDDEGCTDLVYPRFAVMIWRHACRRNRV